MKKTTSTIDSILKNYSPEKVTAPALKAAIEKHKQQQEEQAAEKLLENLKTIDSLMDQEVAKLRDIRKREEVQRRRVININAAKEQFLKDGDYDAFASAYYASRW